MFTSSSWLNSLKGRPIAHGGALLLRLEMQSQGHSAQQVLGHQSLAKNAGETLKLQTGVSMHL
jgi:hypothetical protein